ncbi:MAG: UDP binding domain-containing protein, partial [Candidatus Altiarchaeota archaeon]|nr:UDP binding domain-containing protein [Candidatus Altiarchaeota archaeon]
AREVNDSMPSYMAGLLEDAFREKDIPLDGAVVTVLGLSYKGNILDTRESPAIPLIRILREKGLTVRVCDPVVEPVDASLVPLAKAFDGSDAVLLVTDHNVFRTLDYKRIGKKMRNRIMIDGRNFYGRKAMESLGFAYRGVGKVYRKKEQ